MSYKDQKWPRNAPKEGRKELGWSVKAAGAEGREGRRYGWGDRGAKATHPKRRSARLNSGYVGEEQVNFFEKVVSRSLGTDNRLLRKSVLNSWGTTNVPSPSEQVRMKEKVAKGRDPEDICQSHRPWIGEGEMLWMEPWVIFLVIFWHSLSRVSLQIPGEKGVKKV